MANGEYWEVLEWTQRHWRRPWRLRSLLCWPKGPRSSLRNAAKIIGAVGDEAQAIFHLGKEALEE